MDTLPAGAMKVLIACEYSGRVREAFRALGHDAWSCDIEQPAEDGSPHHLIADAIEVAYGDNWDLMIAHPPCTHLAVSGAKHFEAKRGDGRHQSAIDLFMAFAKIPIPRIAIENPVCVMSTQWREPDQVIQPWMFGHPEFKATCLWLKGLQPLLPTKILPRPKKGTDEWKAWNKVHLMAPGPDRWKNRSRTYEGIASAMAAQWADYTDLVTQMEAA